MKYFFFSVAVFATIACSNKTDSTAGTDSTKAVVQVMKNNHARVRKMFGPHELKTDSAMATIIFTNPRYSEKGTNQLGIAGACALLLYNNFGQEEKVKYTSYRTVFENGVNSKSYSLTKAEVEALNSFHSKARETANLLCTGNYIALKKGSIPQNKLSADSIKGIFGDLFVSAKPLDSVEFFSVFEKEAKLPDSSMIQSVLLKGNFYIEGKTYKYSVGFNKETGKTIGMTCNIKKEDKDYQLPLN